MLQELGPYPSGPAAKGPRAGQSVPCAFLWNWRTAFFFCLFGFSGTSRPGRPKAKAFLLEVACMATDPESSDESGARLAARLRNWRRNGASSSRTLRICHEIGGMSPELAWIWRKVFGQGGTRLVACLRNWRFVAILARCIGHGINSASHEVMSGAKRTGLAVRNS